MEIRYYLNNEEVDRVELTVRYITSRLERPYFIKEGIAYEEPYGAYWQRRDMFWIDCYLDGVNLGEFSVEPDRKNAKEFTLERNYNKVKVGGGYLKLKAKAQEWFKSTEEYKTQCENNQRLIELTEKDRLDGFTEVRKIERDL